MILSSPFSRQNRSHQTWASASGQTSQSQFNSLRRPNQQQQADQQPAAKLARPATLNRLELLRARGPSGRPSSALGQPQPATPQRSAPAAPEIYAPASIASPREYRPVGRPANADSAHYAATSFRGTPSDSGRSGRDSALGGLFERLGTLRRRAKWSRSSRKPAPVGQPPAASDLPPPPPVPTALDPEIYATGKRQVLADEIYAEGSRAIDGNIQRRLLQHQIEASHMSEGETRTLIEEESKRQADYQKLVGSLTNWINDELAQQRIIVTDLQDDLHDGQILGKLVEKLHQVKLDLVEVTQNEATQRQKLRLVLDNINRILSLQARWARIRWSVEGIHGKNLVEIIHLLATLALHYKAPLKLPANVRVRVLVVQKCQGQLVRRSHEVALTEPASEQPAAPGARQQRDAFDTLIEFAPDKLAIVKQSLVKFCNRQLNKINISCFADRVSDILDPEQFSDGLLLVFLIASLEDYFVPLGDLFTAPSSTGTGADDHSLSMSKLETALEPTSYTNTQPIHKLHNVNVALQLMEEAGVEVRDRVRAEDVVNGDLRAVLRVLYALFSRYKHL